jgi:hypothetical protein
MEDNRRILRNNGNCFDNESELLCFYLQTVGSKGNAGRKKVILTGILSN